MNILEMYQRLPKEDKAHLTIYCIYDSIYSTAKEHNVELKNEEVITIQESAYELYLNDDYYHLSSTKISDFLTECYIMDKTFLDKINDISYYDLFDAINTNDYNFLREDEEEMER